MQTNHDVARDISYSSSASTKSGRAVIRVLENATGRLGLIRRAAGYADEVANGADFWQVIASRYGLSLEIAGGSLENIPQTGPVILIANHPYGILDGLMMGRILSDVRKEFRIVAHRVFRSSDELDRIVLPVCFDETKEAMRSNLQTRKDALSYLNTGGAIGIFPGGTVSTSAKPFGQPMDPMWRNFTAKMVTRSNATVVPVYFDGQNSRVFQVASHLHQTLRLALLIKEFKRRTDEPVRVVIGKPIDRQELDNHAENAKTMMDFLRQQTYGLSPKPFGTLNYGYEFEEKYKT